MSSPSIQSAQAFAGSPNAVAFSGANTAGNTIVVGVWVQDNGESVSGVTDSNGNSYSAVVADTSSNGGIALWVATGIIAGANTVTVTVTAGNCGVAIVEEPACSGIRVSASAQQSGGSSDPVISLAGTLVGDVVVGFVNGNGTGQAAGSVGTNPSFIVENIFGDLPLFDGSSSGGSILAGTTGNGFGWDIVALALKTAAASIAVIQNAENSAAATGTTLAVSFASPVATGSVLHCFVANKDVLSEAVTVSDNVNGAWPAAIDTVDDATHLETVRQFSFPGSVSGSITVTATFSVTTTLRAIRVVEIGPAKTSGPLDVRAGQVQASPGAGTDAVTSGAQTNVESPALIVGLSMDNRTVAPAAPAAGTGFADNGAGWNLVSGNQARLESKRVTTTAPIAATFTGTAGIAPTTLMAVYAESDATETFVLTAETGTFTLTGEPVNKAVLMPAAQGAFTLTGETITFARVHNLNPVTGYFSLTGFAVPGGASGSWPTTGEWPTTGNHP